jgi:tyrosyl-tRNA synthetase
MFSFRSAIVDGIEHYIKLLECSHIFNLRQQTMTTLASSKNAAKLPVAPALALTDTVLEALAITKRGVDELLIESEFAQKLARAEQSGQPLRIKLGLDPTAPDLHLGHTVVLNKMRQLQHLGHQVIFLIGDFTSMIGDPSGRNVTRPPLTREQIEQNAMTYFKQASLVLDAGRTEIRYNSEWCDPLGARGIIELSSRYTVARMMERDDFTKRYKSGTPISVHEFLYPLMQGYDSVALKADLELGGTDQKFNLLVGRELQKDYGQEPQCILTMPLLEGLDGVDKMSKSKNNYIGITEPANTMFAKLMSISDTMMWRYFELLSFRSIGELAQLRSDVEAGKNPRDAKVALAQEIVARFHSAQAADEALADFVNRSKGGIPDDVPELALTGAPLGLVQLLKQTGLCASVSEAGRMVDQGGVRIDGVVVSDKALKLDAGSMVLQVGKRKFVRVTLSA